MSSVARGCQPSALDWSEIEAADPAEALSSRGVAIVRGAFSTAALRDVLVGFERLPLAEREVLKFGRLRSGRLQVHLPFREPFSDLAFLGQGNVLEATLAAVLGEDFYLDSIPVVVAAPRAAAMQAHRDTMQEGTVIVHIPLHALTEETAPLSFCVDSHMDKRILQGALDEARLWRYVDESLPDAQRRIVCGSRSMRQVLHLEWGGAELDSFARVGLVPGMRGRVVTGFLDPEAQRTGLQVGDELTHVNEMELDAWAEAAGGSFEENPHRGRGMFRKRGPEVEGEFWIAGGGSTHGGAPLKLRVERRSPGPLSPPSRLLVGAPLAVGDAVLYDSRTVHWGMSNLAGSVRHVLYMEFRSPRTPGQSAALACIKAASTQCAEARDAFHRKLFELRGVPVP